MKTYFGGAMSKRMKESTISDFSERTTRVAGLPVGCEIRFFKKRDGRKVRSDFVLKRRAINTTNLPEPADTDTVSSYLDSVKALLSTELQTRGLDMHFYNQKGQPIVGNTRIGTVRKSDVTYLANFRHAPVFLFGTIVDNSKAFDESLSLAQTRDLYNEFRDIFGDVLDSTLKKRAKAISIKQDRLKRGWDSAKLPTRTKGRPPSTRA